MALIKCPECKQNISDKVIDCPHCGYPLKKELEKSQTINNSKSRKMLNKKQIILISSIVVGIVILVVAIYLVLSDTMGNAVSANSEEMEETNKETEEVKEKDTIFLTKENIKDYLFIEHDVNNFEKTGLDFSTVGTADIVVSLDKKVECEFNNVSVTLKVVFPDHNDVDMWKATGGIVVKVPADGHGEKAFTMETDGAHAEILVRKPYFRLEVVRVSGSVIPN